MRRKFRTGFTLAAIPIIMGCASSTPTSPIQPASLENVSTQESPVVIPSKDLSKVNWLFDDGRVNWDAERIEPLTIVIHHTDFEGGGTIEQLSNVVRDRLYADRFAIKGEVPDVSHLPVQSNHFRVIGGQKTEFFWPYHFLYKEDGREIALLDPTKEVGWHSGRWGLNCASVALVMDGDYTTTRPSAAALEACARRIKLLARRFPTIRFLDGHRDVRPQSTTCPGEWFYQGGREELLKLAGVNLRSTPPDVLEALEARTEQPGDR